MPTNLMDVNAQWRTRPNDERFLSLEALHVACLDNAARSTTRIVKTEDIKFVVKQIGDSSTLGISSVDSPDPMGFTHWSFGQLAALACIPADFARKIPHLEFAAATLNYGINFMAGNSKQVKPTGLFLIENEGQNDAVVTASTSETYGRIWNHQATQALIDMNQDGRWVVPYASYQSSDPLRATTIYGSSHNIFVFLVDPKNPVIIRRPDGKEEILFRGFICWNSQVGAAMFGVKMFLYRSVCDNRIIWGAEDIETILIKHTKGGPERFAYEARPKLEAYANSSAEKVVGSIQRAMTARVPSDSAKIIEWLRSRGFGKAEASNIIAAAVREEGQADSVWDLVQGATSIARDIPHADDRVAAEVKASALLRGF